MKGAENTGLSGWMRNPGRARMALTLFLLLLLGCTSLEARKQEAPAPTKSVLKRANTWQRGSIEYQDRNGDGIPDYERRGEIIPDGWDPITVLEDEDYDGHYDRQILDWGTENQHAMQVHIPVPPRAVSAK